MAEDHHIIYITAASSEETQAIAGNISADRELARQCYQEWLQAEAMTKPQ